MTANRRHLFSLGALVLAVLLFVPWEHAVAPAIRVQVLDEVGKPATGVRVEQDWEYFALGSERQHEISQTDSHGYVSFPARSVRISVARQIPSFLRSLLPHQGEFGPFASMEAHGPDPRAWDIVVCGINNPLPRPLRLKRWDLANQ
jgi:hypothetical protein